MSALDATNDAFVTALRKAGYTPPDPNFRCGHPKQGDNLQFMGGAAVCRICRRASRGAHRERFRRKYMPEAIRRAEDRLARLRAEAQAMGLDSEGRPC